MQSLMAQLVGSVLNPGTKYVLHGESRIMVINAMGLELFWGLKLGRMGRTDTLSGKNNALYALDLTKHKQQRARCETRKRIMPLDRNYKRYICDVRFGLDLALPLVHASTAHPWV